MKNDPNDLNILDRIAVCPPYFALENLSLESDNTLAARTPVHQPMHTEAGSIAVAEIGRHLAILGSCLYREEVLLC